MDVRSPGDGFHHAGRPRKSRISRRTRRENHIDHAGHRIDRAGHTLERVLTADIPSGRRTHRVCEEHRRVIRLPPSVCCRTGADGSRRPRSGAVTQFNLNLVELKARLFAPPRHTGVGVRFPSWPSDVRRLASMACVGLVEDCGALLLDGLCFRGRALACD